MTSAKLFWMRRIAALVLLALALMLLAVIAFSACGGEQKDGEVAIRIAPGSSTADIARQLKDEDVIDSVKDFVDLADDMGVDEKLKPGIYSFFRGEPIEDILNRLASGEQSPEGVLTVPEGFSINDIAEAVSLKTDISERDYVVATRVEGPLPLEGSTGATSLEGFLFPSTYDLEPGITADDLVATQLETFSEQTAEVDWKKADALGLSEYQALVVASMVEREARVPEERPLVAAVIYNRLAEGMKLEVDATVQYALGYWKKDLTYDDLHLDSPYNTRLYAGLPPGPICNPGLDAIAAALDPAPVDYLYYIATGDEEGHHFFTRSYEEFLRMQDG